MGNSDGFWGCPDLNVISPVCGLNSDPPRKNRPVDPTPSGESQEVSSVIVCRLIAASSEFGRLIGGSSRGTSGITSQGQMAGCGSGLLATVAEHVS